ncbi:wall associated protein [Lysobacter antibioticus]|nr:wall associated protein [Lysobacter antibioticus]
MGQGTGEKAVRYLCGVLLAVVSCTAGAQKAPWEEYDKFVKSAQTIKTEGPGLLGDSVNLYTGATSFAATDVSLPGNSDLAVAIGRRFSAQSDARNRPFADWDWDVPYISGTFSRSSGWVIGDIAPDATPNRCSSPTSPETARPPIVKVASSTPGRSAPVQAWEYWSGYRMSVGGGDQELLIATAQTKPRPTDGKTYPWVTKQFWHLSCLPNLQSAHPGEGFLALAPDGTRYRFDWMVARQTDDLVKPFAGDGTILSRPVPRDEIRLYATRVEDRFGNWVAYNWSGNQLASITSSDGRQLSLTWESANGYDRVAKVAVNTTPVREWNYGYSAYSRLTSVTLPDGGQWKLNLLEMWGAPFYEQAEETMADGRRVPVQDKALSCSWMRVLRPLTRTATITHPSGATGEFIFQTIRHGRNSVRSECLPPPNLGGTLPDNPEPEDTLTSMVPARFDVLAIRTKRITGAGLPADTWNYDYTTPVGSWEDGCANCATTKTTTVTGPGGERTVNTYGVVFNANEGQLLKTEVFAGNALLRTSATEYLSNTAAEQQNVFAHRMGISPQVRLDSFSSESLRPVTESSTQQDGATFANKVNGFDVFAQPTNRTEVSSLGYSRTNTTEYYADLSKWVIGQVQKETNVNTGAVVSQADYDAATALPVRTYAYGKLQQTLEYYPDGTLSALKDGRNLTTSLSNWKRGMPQTIRFQDGAKKDVVVDNNGWVASVTDENGHVMNYSYDLMGRMTRIVYPTGDDTVWNDTALSFEQVAGVEYGLPAGHWRHVVSTGNGKKTTYFDALWRPVIEQEEDIADPQSTARWTMKCYDPEGRVTFSSYPRNPFTEGAPAFDCAGLTP